jgi:Domain of unknown function (DUF4348)
MLRFSLICVLFCCFLACKQKNQPANRSASSETGNSAEELLPADFTTFYDRFHTDSAFQMEHIVFPVDGVATVQEGDMIKRIAIKHTAQNWLMHRPVEGTDYVKSYQLLGDKLVEEVIRYSAADYGMKRRFAKMSGEWYLIYYDDMQDMGQPAR